MKRIAPIIIAVLCLTLGGCVSWYAREDFDQYKGACATSEGNGRTTNMAASQPVGTPAVGPVDVTPQPIYQADPSVGDIFNLRVNGKTYDAIRKTDGKVYIIREVK
jgi:hypothetical protein